MIPRQPVCQSLCPSRLESLPPCQSAGLVSVQARNAPGGGGGNAQRTSSKLQILLSAGCFWEYLRMPEGRAAEACRGAGADGQKARVAVLRRRDLELATPVR